MSLWIALSLAASAHSISAGEFLSRAEPMLARSKMTLIFSPEARTLMGILGEAAQRTRARLDADRAAGRAVATCLPPKGKATINAMELVAYLRSLSPADRAKSFDAAFAGYAARKYPCRR